MPLPSLMLLNARSLLPKLDELYAIAKTHLPSLIIVTESWLNEEVDSSVVCLPGYAQPFRRDREERRGGGVCVYVSADVRSFNVSPATRSFCPVESLWICLPDYKILLFAAYIPPNLLKDQAQSLVQIIIDEADLLINNYPNFHLILTGDFNPLTTTGHW
jgi:hypothetical protein